MKQKKTKKQWILFFTGSIAIIAGCSILLYFGGRKLYRIYQEQMLMRENPVLEIAALDIKAPVLEGTDQQTLRKAVGHFTGTGDFGSGNYCIAGHSSTIYKEYFNRLKNIENGMQISLYDAEKNRYDYSVTESFVVEPNETWVLDDAGDDRITIITCTDDGSQRLVVSGALKRK
ncbi:MAG: sortase [Oscillospiraceae bacterium]|nr:sortase [Oscillospiraceae bacterium]